jgi:hypothetical protein
MTRPKFILAHKPDPNRRTSPNSAWPIRLADGRTPAQVRPHYEAKASAE